MHQLYHSIKNTKNVRWCILALAICSAFCASGCMDSRTLAKDAPEVLQTIELQGCEYFFTEFSARQSNNYAVAINASAEAEGEVFG